MLLQYLLRTIAVVVGLVFLVFGGLFVAACVGLIGKGPDAPAAEKVGMAVQVVATLFFGLVALCGGVLIWLGLRRGNRPAEVVANPAPCERSVSPAEPLEPVAVCREETTIAEEPLEPVWMRREEAAIAVAEPEPIVATMPAPSRRPVSGAGPGQFIARCGPEKDGETYNYVSAAVYLAIAVLCIIAPGRFFELKIDPALAAKLALVPAGLCLGAALLYLWSPLFGAPQTIELYENSLVERLGKKVRSIELAAIERLRVREWYEHRFAARTFTVEAQVHGQPQLRFNSALRGEAERIIEYLASCVPQTEFVEFDATL
jgi:hypothetical protein